MLDTCRSASVKIFAPFDTDKLEAELKQALATLGGPADLIFLFLTPDLVHDLPEFIEACQIGLRCPTLVGSSTGTVISDGSNYEDCTGLGLLALRLPGTTVTIEAWPATGIPSTTAPAGGAGAVLLAHPDRLQADDFTTAWNARYPGLPAFGAIPCTDEEKFGGEDEELAEDFPDEELPPPPAPVCLFTQHGESSAACLAVHFHGGIRLDAALGQSCRPIGPAMVITGTNHNRITSLDGASPMQGMLHALADESKRTGHKYPPAEGLVHLGIMAESPGDNDLPVHGCVRAITEVDERSGAISIEGNPEIGQIIRFHWRDDADASSRWHDALEATKSRQPDLPVAGLLFSCSSRGYGFFEFPDHDPDMMCDRLGQFPMAGMFSTGQLASPLGPLEAHAFCSVGVCFYPASTHHG